MKQSNLLGFVGKSKPASELSLVPLARRGAKSQIAPVTVRTVAKAPVSLEEDTTRTPNSTVSKSKKKNASATSATKKRGKRDDDEVEEECVVVVSAKKSGSNEKKQKKKKTGKRKKEEIKEDEDEDEQLQQRSVARQLKLDEPFVVNVDDEELKKRRRNPERKGRPAKLEDNVDVVDDVEDLEIEAVKIPVVQSKGTLRMWANEVVQPGLMGFLDERTIGSVSSNEFSRRIWRNCFLDYEPVCAYSENIKLPTPYTLRTGFGRIGFGGDAASLSIYDQTALREAYHVDPIDPEGLTIEEITKVVPHVNLAGVAERWVSDMAFLSENNVVVSSDDGTLTLFGIQDLMLNDGPGYNLVLQSRKHEEYGIYSCDASRSLSSVAMGLKSGHVKRIDCESFLDTADFPFSLKCKVVKACRYSLFDEEIVAACGEKDVRVFDFRQRDSTGILLSGHRNVSNHVAWHPFVSNQLLSCSYDDVILVHDLRKFSAPLSIVMGLDRRNHKPCWTASGNRIAVASKKLVLYDPFQADVISCVPAPFSVNLAHVLADDHLEDVLYSVSEDGTLLSLRAAIWPKDEDE